MKQMFYTVATLLLLCGCGESEKELPSPKEQSQLVPIQFSLDLEKEEVPFSKTKGMPALNIPEPTTSSTSQQGDVQSGQGKLYDNIDYIVYKKGTPDTMVKHKHFKIGDPDFSIIYDSLPEGSYNICFLAHSDKLLAITGQTAQFKDVTDAFHLFMQQDIIAGEKIIKDINLRRIVSRIEFVSTDTPYETLKDFTINVSNYQDKVDLTTGLGISTNKNYNSSYLFQPADMGKSGISHSFLTLVPANSSKLLVNITTKDKKEATRRIWELNDVTPIANKIIRYTGILYTPKVSNDKFSIDIINGGLWDKPVENQLKE